MPTALAHGWLATGDGYLRRPGRSPWPIASRDSLVYSTYEPSTATAGLTSSEASLTEYNSPSTNAVTIPDGATITGQVIYGKVTFAGAATITNCLFVGPSTTLSSGNDGVLNCTNTRTGIAVLTDCEIRPRAESAGRNCVLGEQFELYRCWLHGGEDGGGIYPSGGRTAANVKVKGCLIEDMAYTYPDRDHSDGSHPDGIQIQGGTNIEIVGNSINGTAHRMAGSSTYYTANPTSSLGDWPLTMSTARAPGAGIIIQNNVSAPFDSTVIIDGNYFRWGGKAMLLVKSTANNFVCRNNRFSALNPPASNVNGTVVGGVTLAFTYSQYFVRFDAIGTSNNITGLVSGGALANTTNVWLDGGSAGTALTTPRASGVTSDA